MRSELNKIRKHDTRINYRGSNASRIDNLSDSVFGIAITLLIFNLANPNSFSDLLTFTKTLPAFLISISFLVLIWYEHLRFSEVYTLNDTYLTILNTIFIALIVFYVYPLRFLTLFLTNFFFNTSIDIKIYGDQVPFLMIYYGFIVFALYFILYLFYKRAIKLKLILILNEFEVFYTNAQITRLRFMFIVPILSVILTYLINLYSFIWASVIGGVVYILYTPAVIYWAKKYEKNSQEFK